MYRPSSIYFHHDFCRICVYFCVRNFNSSFYLLHKEQAGGEWELRCSQSFSQLMTRTRLTFHHPSNRRTAFIFSCFLWQKTFLSSSSFLFSDHSLLCFHFFSLIGKNCTFLFSSHAHSVPKLSVIPFYFSFIHCRYCIIKNSVVIISDTNKKQQEEETHDKKRVMRLWDWDGTHCEAITRVRASSTRGLRIEFRNRNSDLLHLQQMSFPALHSLA